MQAGTHIKSVYCVYTHSDFCVTLFNWWYINWYSILSDKYVKTRKESFFFVCFCLLPLTATFGRKHDFLENKCSVIPTVLIAWNIWFIRAICQRKPSSELSIKQQQNLFFLHKWDSIGFFHTLHSLLPCTATFFFKNLLQTTPYLCHVPLIKKVQATVSKKLHRYSKKSKI